MPGSSSNGIDRVIRVGRTYAEGLRTAILRFPDPAFQGLVAEPRAVEARPRGPAAIRSSVTVPHSIHLREEFDRGKTNRCPIG